MENQNEQINNTQEYNKSHKSIKIKSTGLAIYSECRKREW